MFHSIFDIVHDIFNCISLVNQVYNKHRHLSIESNWINRKIDLRSLLTISLVNSRNKDIRIQFLGLYSQPYLKGEPLVNPLFIYSNEYEDKMGQSYKINSHNSLRIHISIRDLVNSFFNKHIKVTKDNWLNVTLKHNISNLTDIGLDIKYRLKNNKPIYLWSCYSFMNSEGFTNSIAQGLITISPNNMYYRPLKKYFIYKEGLEAGQRIISYENNANRWLLCQKIFDEKEFLSPKFQDGFLIGCKESGINGQLYIELSKEYQSHDGDSFYHLGFIEEFSGSMKEIMYRDNKNYKKGINDARHIINEYK